MPLRFARPFGMSAQIGYVDPNGQPRLTIRVRGTHPTQFAELDAFVDTGFAGFLMLPITLALPLGLVLYGTGEYNLADGSLISCFLAEGTIEIRPPFESPAAASTAPAQPANSVTGAIVIGGDDALLGMESIRRLNKWLLVSSTVALIDGADLPALLLPRSLSHEPLPTD